MISCDLSRELIESSRVVKNTRGHRSDITKFLYWTISEALPQPLLHNSAIGSHGSLSFSKIFRARVFLTPKKTISPQVSKHIEVLKGHSGAEKLEGGMHDHDGVPQANTDHVSNNKQSAPTDMAWEVDMIQTVHPRSLGIVLVTHREI